VKKLLLTLNVERAEELPQSEEIAVNIKCRKSLRTSSSLKSFHAHLIEQEDKRTRYLEKRRLKP